MVWVYEEYFESEGYMARDSIQDVKEEFNDIGELADLFPNAIYFYAELTTEL